MGGFPCRPDAGKLHEGYATQDQQQLAEDDALPAGRLPSSPPATVHWFGWQAWATPLPLYVPHYLGRPMTAG